MKNKSFPTHMVIGLGLLLGLPLSAMAQERFDHNQLLRQIGLEKNKMKEIEELTYKSNQEKLDLIHEMEKLRLDMEHLMDADRPDESRIFAKLEQISASELKLKKNRIGLLLKIRQRISPEQWDKLKEAHSKRKMFRQKDKMRKKTQERPPRAFGPDP